MTRFNVEKTNFNSGEVGPKFYSRTDIDRYANAMRACRNMVPLLQGPVTHRPGFNFANEVKTSGLNTKLLRFEFNVTQTYFLEFGNNYIRFYTNEAIILNTSSVLTGIGQPIGLTLLFTQANSVYNLNNMIYEIASPYTAAELDQISYSQIGDILFLYHPNHWPRELRRLTATTFSLVDFDFLDGPFDIANGTATTLTPSGTTGDITITASTAIFTDSTNDLYKMLIRIFNNSKWGCVKITSKVSDTVVNATVQTGFTLGNTSATTNWRMGSWSNKKGWPSVSTFYQQRSIIANNRDNPDTIWGSTSEDFRTFSPTDSTGAVQDNKGFNYPIGSDSVNAIVSMVTGKVISVFTRGGEWILAAGSATNPDPLTPTSVKVTQETTYGSQENIPSLRIEAAGIFADKSGRKIREFIYNYNSDSYNAADLTLLCDHLFTQSKIKTMAWAEHPNSIMWVALENGDLLSMTYSRAQQVVGFAKHELGGEYVPTGTPLGLLLLLTQGEEIKPQVRSIVSGHSPDGTHTQVWAIIRRRINGETKDYVEFMKPFFEPAHARDFNNIFFVDSGLSATTTLPVSTIAGLNHLENMEVSIVTDGVVQNNKIVSGGSITLDTPGKIVTVGLYRRAYIHTLTPTQGGNAGTAMAKIKRIHKLAIYLVNTIGLIYGQLLGREFPIYFRFGGSIQDEAVDLFTGLKKQETDNDYSEEQVFELAQEQPLPITIGAIYMDGNVNEV